MATNTTAGPTASSSQPILPGVTRYSDVKNAAKPVNEQMGKTEFLTLFTTQLQNQNPLDPVNNEAFVAQLAQFSQLEASTNMSASLEKMANSLKGERFMAGAQLIGKQVTAPMGNARYEPGATISGLLSLPTGADRVNLDVYDNQNRKVFSQSLGRQAPGDLKLSWDGSLDAGGMAAAGTYRIIATVSSLGKTTQTPISTPLTVKSVTYSPADDDLIIEVEGGATVPLSQLSRIEAPPAQLGQSGATPAGATDAQLNDRINNSLNQLLTRPPTIGPAAGNAGGSTTSPLDQALKNLFRP